MGCRNLIPKKNSEDIIHEKIRCNTRSFESPNSNIPKKYRLSEYELYVISELFDGN